LIGWKLVEDILKKMIKRAQLFFRDGAIILTHALLISILMLSLVTAQTQEQVTLTEDEIQFLNELGPIKMVVDPDWYPYEQINERGLHEGIAADILMLVFQRLGIEHELIETSDWSESIAVSKSGEAHVISFLNHTPERDEWLTFTDSYFSDPSVLITRDEHALITDLKKSKNEIVALPRGTSVEERLRNSYPELKIVLVETEAQALEMISNKTADMTIRSKTMAAYVIREERLFNLKIAGEVPDTNNRFRIGVNKELPMLRTILNKGIQTLSQKEIEGILNSYIVINVEEKMDLTLILTIASALIALVTISYVWNLKLNRLNHKLMERQKELEALKLQLEQDINKRKLIESALQENIQKDQLTGIFNRHYFVQKVHEDMELSDRYQTPLSLIFFDLDHFKKINDDYGHDLGDEVLIKVTRTLKKTIRTTDSLIRWGGEEFLVLMPETDISGAKIVAEKMRVEAANIKHGDGFQVTASFGVVERLKGEYLESWFKRADQALYQAKSTGRNKVIASISDDIPENVQRYLVWKSEWASGDSHIDRQHKKLLELGNELVHAALSQESSEQITNKFDVFYRCLIKHFDDEEKKLITIGFSDLEHHQSQHQLLLEKVAQLKESLFEDEESAMHTFRFIQKEVVHDHLLVEDIKYFNYI
jgi:diguanylate cyclase (GGDEF)-like protein/hemerythrin-like metal-binding protein